MSLPLMCDTHRQTVRLSSCSGPSSTRLRRWSIVRWNGMFPQKFHYEGARFMPLQELPSCSGHSASDAARENNPIYRWSGASAADASRFGAIDCCCGAVHQIDYSAPPTLAPQREAGVCRKIGEEQDVSFMRAVPRPQTPRRFGRKALSPYSANR